MPCAPTRFRVFVMKKMAELNERRLSGDDIPQALLLSAEANWNQVAADWRIMLGLGAGFGFVEPGGRLVASAIALPFQGPFGWISMVLVTAAHRRKLLATRLMQRCIDHLTAMDRTPMLDATPAGREVYLGMGFHDGWGLKRWTGAASAQFEPGPDRFGIRGIREPDWPAIAALDARAFGADRMSLLRHLAARWPEAALMAIADNNDIAGFALGRDGRTARQIGPVVAQAEPIAGALINAVLAAASGPIYIDLADRWTELGAQLAASAFTVQRPYTRMSYGTHAAFSDSKLLCAIAGPELA